jgi:hypothetical protein
LRAAFHSMRLCGLPAHDGTPAAMQKPEAY